MNFTASFLVMLVNGTRTCSLWLYYLMNPSNPYLSPSLTSSLKDPKPKKSIALRILLGFGIGASIPATLGIYGLYQFHVYVASLPPDHLVCGNPMLGCLGLIVFGSPFLGLPSACIAAILP